jgi:hypothetical protein
MNTGLREYPLTIAAAKAARQKVNGRLTSLRETRPTTDTCPRASRQQVKTEWNDPIRTEALLYRFCRSADSCIAD